MTDHTPDIEWLEDGVPKASRFDDTYFSRAGGLEETRHVFLAGNGLPERFADRQHFVIGELGFGTGLNFLTVLHALSASTAATNLTFMSFELYPMSSDQLQQALSAFPEVEREAEGLLQVWSPEPGWNCWQVGQATLQLAVGDAREMLGQAKEQPGFEPVDAWFLDGFSPAKNPELWEPELLKAASSISAEDATLATYTSAGWVRRNLQAAGFEVSKQKGFAGKREMVVGWRKAADGV